MDKTDQALPWGVILGWGILIAVLVGVGVGTWFLHLNGDGEIQEFVRGYSNVWLTLALVGVNIIYTITTERGVRAAQMNSAIAQAAANEAKAANDLQRDRERREREPGLHVYYNGTTRTHWLVNLGSGPIMLLEQRKIDPYGEPLPLVVREFTSTDPGGSEVPGTILSSGGRLALDLSKDDEVPLLLLKFWYEPAGPRALWGRARGVIYEKSGHWWEPVGEGEEPPRSELNAIEVLAHEPDFAAEVKAAEAAIRLRRGATFDLSQL